MAEILNKNHVLKKCLEERRLYSYDFLVAKLFHKSKCPSISMSVCPSGLGGNVIFSAPNWDIAPIFLCWFPSKMSIYSVNILSICLSVMLQKALLLMDVVILVYLSIDLVWKHFHTFKYPSCLIHLFMKYFVYQINNLFNYQLIYQSINPSSHLYKYLLNYLSIELHSIFFFTYLILFT